MLNITPSCDKHLARAEVADLEVMKRGTKYDDKNQTRQKGERNMTSEKLENKR